MQNATLLIALSATVVATVEDALLLDGEIVRGVAERDGVKEQEQMQLEVVATTLAGAALPQDLPPGRLRARVLLGEDVVLDGTTQRELIACSAPYDGGERVWTVRVQNEAARDFWDALEALDLDAIKAAVPNVAVSTIVGGGSPENLTWYAVGAMATTAVGRVATLTGGLNVFDGGIRYLDGDDEPATFFPPDTVYIATASDVERDDTTYPKGTGKDLVEAVVRAHALTLDAAYAAWPSFALTVGFRSGRWIETAPSVALDDHAEEDWDVSVQAAEQEDFALSMPVGETEAARGYLSDLGGYAAQTWRRNPKGEPTNTSLVSLEPFALPSYEWTNTETVSVTYSAAYTESQLRARPVLEVDATDVWHLLVVRDGKGIFERRPASPAPGFVVQLETWAAALYPAHALSAYSRTEVRGQFDVETVTLPNVGSEGRVEVDGLNLAVVEASINEDTHSATLALARPVPEYDAVAAFPPAFAPINLQGEILPTTPAGGYWMRVTWHPDARTMLPVSYEAEWNGVAGWEALTVCGDARIPYAEINGVGETDSQIVRVRAVYVTGAVSEWLTEVLP